MFLVYKFFTWTVLILISLFGATLVGALLGALGMAWLLDETRKLGTPKKTASTPR